jgi:hypothetical protein
VGHPAFAVSCDTGCGLIPSSEAISRTDNPRPTNSTAACPVKQRASSLTFAEAEFLLNVAGQADKALRLIADGPRLSTAIAEDIRDLRNLHEH